MYPVFLMLDTLGKILGRQHIEIFFLYFPEDRFDISCKLSQLETICMQCKSCFLGENMKNVTIWSSAELAKRVVKVKISILYIYVGN